jgi:hypothetical protein
MKMKNRIRVYHSLILLVLLMLPYMGVLAQDEPAKEDSVVEKPKNKPARKAFGSPLLIDNQTDVVEVAKTLEFTIQHRFGTLENGAADLYGIFAPANIRFALNYSLSNRLQLGIGVSKVIVSYPKIDLNLKFKILQQMQSGGSPVNITYFGNMVIDTNKPENFDKDVHRLSYFNELIISRRFGPKFSAQVAPMISHFNAVDSLYRHDIFGVSLGIKFKVSNQGSIVFEWTQPLNQHYVNDPVHGSLQKDAGPKPNLAIGYDIVTSSHSFQFFICTYRDILPQYNLAYNTNTLTKDGKPAFLIGFNLTRLWNF